MSIDAKKYPKISICLCSFDTINMKFMEYSWNPLVYYGQPDFSKVCQVMRGSVSVAQKRNMMVNKALSDKDVTHIFMLDNDVLYEDCNGDINTALRFMLALNLPIVGGLMRVRGYGYPYMVYSYDGIKQIFETIPAKYFKRRDKILEVEGIGMGFTLIKREVFDRMERPYYLEDKYTEDFYFCLKAKVLGYPTYAVNDIHLSHINLMKIKADGSIVGVDN